MLEYFFNSEYIRNNLSEILGISECCNMTKSPTMLDNLNAMRPKFCPIGGQFECISTISEIQMLKNFANQIGSLECISTYLGYKYSKYSPTMKDNLSTYLLIFECTHVYPDFWYKLIDDKEPCPNI